MSNAIVPIGQQVGALTASMRNRMAALAAQANKSFTSGVTASYPLLSIRGKEFTFRLPDGREQTHVDAQGYKMPYIDVVLVDASAQLSKAFYDKGFDPSEFTRPDCWSLDSLKPDSTAPAQQPGWTGSPCASTCGGCIQNQFGSKITDAGKKAKACQDHRRMVVLLPHQVGQENAAPLAMRVPQSSLKNLKAHAELLGNYGVDTKACVTRMSFTNEAFPQLVFTYVSMLNEQEWDWILELADSSKVKGMLQTPDFDQAVSTPVQQTPAHNAGLQALPSSPPPVAFQQLMQQPVEEEEEEAAPVVTAPSVALIELPDGRLYNPVTKQYVEPEPEPEPAEEDPDVITLPDGKFFNTKTRQYVESTLLGKANVVEPPAVAAKKTRVRKPKEAPVVEAKAEAPVTKVNGAAPAPTADVIPASDALESVLKGLLPPVTK